MAKGKKFDAAEKHFEKKRVKYESEIRHLTDIVSEQNKIISKNEQQISALETENTQLKDWVERLLEYTELSKEDIKAVCEKDKRLGESLELLKSLKIVTGCYNN